jgi:hypothetical protein
MIGDAQFKNRDVTFNPVDVGTQDVEFLALTILF